ncbi:glycoside hydrolase family 3 C-terminal domain-containing protein [Mycolicibacterium sp. S3B2]|uniref:glycoside hydrolase family 3 C-terminal domain-containing protein n=1 Tax=Mycolicibacterium sp. S3B2 TaxID=3415120 RepID=UPI003C7DA6DB
MTTPPTEDAVLAELSLAEKAALTSGTRFWYTQSVERLQLPAIMLTDGPHGLRKQRAGGDHLGIGDSVPATCFPPAAALGSSWDAGLVERVGAALGTEAANAEVGVLLGPGLNIKRTPLCGRNFEYLSEDPLVSGVLAAALVAGIQSRGVGACPKHFAANNQEHDRMRVSADVDPRPLREIYLRGFEHVVTEAHPWVIMCSYNRINGVHTAEDPWLLTTVLRHQWGFAGLVVSDWGAVNDRVASLIAGLDLDMPGSTFSAAQIIDAVAAGSLDEDVLDRSVRRVLHLVRRTRANQVSASFDSDEHHALAREAAGRGIVLLKNDDGLLPLPTQTRIAVIGEFAQSPRYQGAGSSMIVPTRLNCALDEIRSQATGDVVFARGFTTEADSPSGEAERLLDEAVDTAAHAEVAVVFLGLPARCESEGFDRDDLDLPAPQLRLLDAVVAVNPRTVVVLSNGGVVALPFASKVPAILEGWLLGQAGGAATADVLFGAVNPSAKLTETIPARVQDTPAHLTYPGEFGHVRYGEGLFVGYRWYDARCLEVAFPFGHGLSYTSFDYTDAVATVDSAGGLAVSVTVTNTGGVAGREIVQVYTSLPGSGVTRPPRELKAFTSVHLDSGASTRITMPVRRQDLAYWDIRVDSWVVEGGAYTVDVAASSRDIRSTVTVAVDGDDPDIPLSPMSSLAEVFAHPVAGPIVASAFADQMASLAGGDGLMPEGVDMSRMLDSLPIGKVGMLASAAGVEIDPAMISELLDRANDPPD